MQQNFVVCVLQIDNVIVCVADINGVGPQGMYLKNE